MRHPLVLVVFIVFLQGVLRAQHHDHREVFAVTGAINADVERGRMSYAEGLRQKALLLVNPEGMATAYRPAPGTIFKCLTPVSAELYRARQTGRSTPEVDALLTAAEKRTLPQTTNARTLLSPSGKFEFTYETGTPNGVPTMDNNSNGVPDYVEWAAFAADSSWRYMVTRQGYRDFVLPGITYKVTFQDFGFYGITYPAGSTTRIVVHSNFDGFPPNTHPEGQKKGAVLVTVGHELKHSIQYMYGGWDKDSENYLEMDATMYEDVTFDDVNDYYNYLVDSRSIFRNPSGSLFSATYYHATWALFFREKYGPLFWPAVWQQVVNQNTTYLFNLRDAVTARGGSLQRDILENQLFHAAIGDTTAPGSQGRSLKNFGFEERLFYPFYTTASALLQQNGAFQGQSAQHTINGLAARHLLVRPVETDTGNVYISLSYEQSRPHTGIAVVVERKDRSHRMYVLPALTDRSFVEVRIPERWENIRKVIGAIANTNIATTSATGSTFQVIVRYEISNKTSIPVNSDIKPVRSFALAQNFPNPFNPSTTIRFSLPAAAPVSVQIFDITGKQVATAFRGNAPAGETAVTLDASALPSGVYLYRLSTPSGTLVKRMTLVK